MKFVFSFVLSFCSFALFAQGNLNITFDIALEGVSTGNTVINVFKGNELIKTLTSADNKIFNCTLESGGYYTAEIRSNSMTPKRVAIDLKNMSDNQALTTLHVPVGLKSNILIEGVSNELLEFPIATYYFDAASQTMAENIAYSNFMNELAFSTLQQSSLMNEGITFEE